MYFQFEDSRPDTPSLDAAMSRREGVLLSLVGHAVALLLIVLVPALPMVQEAAARRALEAERYQAELLEQQRARDREARRFVFVQPLIDTEALVPPDAGFYSDLDRSARAPERSADPTNPLPFARGNSSDLVILPDMVEPEGGDGPAPEPAEGDRAGEASERVAEAADTDAVDSPESEDVADAEAGDLRSRLGELEFADPTESRIDAPRVTSRSPTAIPPLAGGPLGEAIRNLQRYVDQESFNNPRGDSGQFGPSIQFDTKGVEFGPWIGRFIAQIKRNWLVPYAAMAFKGHTVITFNVHKSGALTDVTVLEPSTVDSFNTSARNALLASNPTQPLPAEYPSDTAFFTVTFYYNERPPTY